MPYQRSDKGSVGSKEKITGSNLGNSRKLEFITHHSTYHVELRTDSAVDYALKKPRNHSIAKRVWFAEKGRFTLIYAPYLGE
ncbi:hypothetical protein SOASR030_14920 [Leminorella grimontii]|uniref:Uncharacterized protein n=1 Tax=Leminorella grimontii TaxID=82981 RepID=A0AAV5MZU3_9GAMM|nr:hypothetical protein SOASR030_14920 [Leminorella grimontii]